MKKRVILIGALGAFLIGIVFSLFFFTSKNDKEAVAEGIKEAKLPSVSLKMVGDNLIHNTLYFAAKTETGYNFDSLYENVKDDIKNADIAIINQETIFVEDSTKYSSFPTFGSPTAVGDAIVKAGFDVVAHSSNHANDKGKTGITDTLTFWRENYPDIKVLGIHDNKDESDITYLEKNDIKFSFLNYTYGLNGYNLSKENSHMIDVLGNDKELKSNLREAEENSDVVIAILHIGTEYVYKPSTYHKKYVDFCIDNGADVVLCAHPHVLEPYETVTTKNGNTGLVYYSLGNFISNQKEVPRLLGGMANITFEKDKDGQVIVKDYSLIPLVTHYEKGFYTTYKLSDYTNELARKHTISETHEFSVEILKKLYGEIMGED